ncbi:311_t:CDS:1, partial [Funneliformis mosseae]
MSTNVGKEPDDGSQKQSKRTKVVRMVSKVAENSGEILESTLSTTSS